MDEIIHYLILAFCKAEKQPYTEQETVELRREPHFCSSHIHNSTPIPKEEDSGHGFLIVLCCPERCLQAMIWILMSVFQEALF